jgi:hypothetical protein
MMAMAKGTAPFLFCTVTNFRPLMLSKKARER